MTLAAGKAARLPVTEVVGTFTVVEEVGGEGGSVSLDQQPVHVLCALSLELSEHHGVPEKWVMHVRHYLRTYRALFTGLIL